jgi:hypothetical protein
VQPRWILLLFVLCIPASALAGAGEAPPHVRATDSVVRASIARGMALSATFRRLVDRLEASDVIVHVTRLRRAGRPSGFTQFVATTPYGRYVRITLEADDSSDAVVALLGHELRHAVEAADAPAVTDQPTYHTLYRAIGRSFCGPPKWCFDTTDAVTAGQDIYGELRATRRRLSARLTASDQQQRHRND